MANIFVKEIVNDLASELGPQASFLRKEEDRLYLSGIEIALVIASGILASFLAGVVKGIQSALKAKGEKLGQEIVDYALKRLETLIDNVSNLSDGNTEQETERTQSELQQLMDSFAEKGLLDDATTAVPQVTEQIVLYLSKIGFPSDSVEEVTRQSVVIVLDHVRDNED